MPKGCIHTQDRCSPARKMLPTKRTLEAISTAQLEEELRLRGRLSLKLQRRHAKLTQDLMEIHRQLIQHGGSDMRNVHRLSRSSGSVGSSAVATKRGRLRQVMDEIVEQVCRTYGVSLVALRSSARHRPLVHARHVAMYLIRSFASAPLMLIAKYFRRDHTTVMHSVDMGGEILTSNAKGRRLLRQYQHGFSHERD